MSVQYVILPSSPDSLFFTRRRSDVLFFCSWAGQEINTARCFERSNPTFRKRVEFGKRLNEILKSRKVRFLEMSPQFFDRLILSVRPLNPGSISWPPFDVELTDQIT